MARPIVSIIVTLQNDADQLDALFEALGNQKGGYPFEVHIVDNASSDGSYRIAKRLAKGRAKYHVWKCRKENGAVARNCGARKAKGKILLFTNADCRPSANWVNALAEPLATTQPYPLAAIGGKVLLESPKPPTFWDQYLDRFLGALERDRLSPAPAFLPWAPIQNFGVNKKIFLELGGFDENWRNAGFDVDFCWRLALCGFVLGYSPEAEVLYRRGSSLPALLKRMEQHSFYSHNLLKTYAKQLELPPLKVRADRAKGKAKKIASSLRPTRSLSEMAFRGIDSLGTVSVIKGRIVAGLKGVKPDPKIHPTRAGQIPESLKRLLPRGYAHLQASGWIYWKSPAAIHQKGKLVLYRPRERERYSLSETSWKIWEVKAEKGQSEDAALALGMESSDTESLRKIDFLTVDLRTRRLIP